MAAASEPGYGAGAPAAQPAPIPDAYSTAPGDGAANRAARADGVVANHVEDKQNLQGGAGKSKRIDEVTKLVAEEAASRSKFPRYAGLERWELIEKMGDGAFSNVYRARDLEGDAGEVAIKVVRKFEMNSMQVSTGRSPAILLPPALPLFFVFCFCHPQPSPGVFLGVICFSVCSLDQLGGHLSRAKNISIRTSYQRLPKPQRCEYFYYPMFYLLGIDDSTRNVLLFS